VLIVGAITIVTLSIGAIAYGVHVHTSTLPGLIVTLVLGTAAFTTLGVGVVRFISSADIAPVIVNLTVLPLTFISGVWFPTNGMPKLLNDVANVFPIKPLANGLQYAFNPHTTGAGFNATDVRSLLIWTAVGTFMMIRYLRRPQGETG
jgi:ABC-2 type transport system permease protein